MKSERTYYLKCGKCGGITFSLAREITLTLRPGDDEESQWHGLEINALFAHEGFGWDINEFQMRCSQCGAFDSGHVMHESKKTEGEQPEAHEGPRGE